MDDRMSDDEEIIVDGEFVVESEIVNMYAVTVKQQATVLFMQRVRQWFLECEAITVVAGSLEVGEAGHRHWQMSVQSQLHARGLRAKLLAQFPELLGKDKRKGNKYSIAVQRKSWATNVAYCNKTVTDDTVESDTVWKGVDKDDIMECRDVAQAEMSFDVGQRAVKGTWNVQLAARCKSDGASVFDDFGISICEKYLESGKTLPDKYALRRLVTTVMAMSHEPDSDERREIVEQLVSDARRL